MGDKGSPLPLHEATAASEPNFTVVKYLMEHYPDHVQTQDEEGCLPLHYAVLGMIGQGEEYQLQIVKELINQYPDGLRVRNQSGFLPLHASLQTSFYEEIVLYVLEAFPEATTVADDEGNLPLHYVERNWPFPARVLQALISANPRAKEQRNQLGHRPIDLVLAKDRTREHQGLLFLLIPDSSLKGSKKKDVHLQQTQQYHSTATASSNILPRKTRPLPAPEGHDAPEPDPTEKPTLPPLPEAVPVTQPSGVHSELVVSSTSPALGKPEKWRDESEPRVLLRESESKQQAAPRNRPLEERATAGPSPSKTARGTNLHQSPPSHAATAFSQQALEDLAHDSDETSTSSDEIPDSDEITFQTLAAKYRYEAAKYQQRQPHAAAGLPPSNGRMLHQLATDVLEEGAQDSQESETETPLNGHSPLRDNPPLTPPHRPSPTLPTSVQTVDTINSLNVSDVEMDVQLSFHEPSSHKQREEKPTPTSQGAQPVDAGAAVGPRALWKQSSRPEPSSPDEKPVAGSKEAPPRALNLRDIFPSKVSSFAPDNNPSLYSYLNSVSAVTTAAEALSHLQEILRDDPSAAEYQDSVTGRLPLHVCCQRNLPQQLSLAVLRANPEAASVLDRERRLPLHYSVIHGTPPRSSEERKITEATAGETNALVISELLKSFPDGVMFRDHAKCLPLHLAIEARANPQLISTLLKAYPAGASAEDALQRTPLLLAITLPDPDPSVLSLIVRHSPLSASLRNGRGRFPLHELVLRQVEVSPEALRVLIEAYQEAVSAPDDDGRLPLHYALTHVPASPQVVTTLLSYHPEAVKVPDAAGWLPLHVGVEAVSAAVTARFVARVTGRSPKPQTPDSDSVWSGGSPALTDATPISPAHQLRFLVDNTSTSTIDALDMQPRSLDALMTVFHSYTEAALHQDKEGRTPLHIAVSYRRPSIALLAMLGKRPEATLIKNKDGCLPLHCAARAYPPRRAVVVAMLGGDRHRAEAQDIDGRIPLHHALAHRLPSLPVVESLIQAFPEGLELKDHRGETPVQVFLRTNPTPDQRRRVFQRLYFPEAPQSQHISGEEGKRATIVAQRSKTAGETSPRQPLQRAQPQRAGGSKPETKAERPSSQQDPDLRKQIEELRKRIEEQDRELESLRTPVEEIPSQDARKSHKCCTIC